MSTITAAAPAKPIHGAPKPRDVPADMTDAPPRPFPFRVGEVVNYTNDNGLTARARIRGFANPPHGGHSVPVKLLGDDGKVAGIEHSTIPERFVYLEHWSAQGWRLGAWWFAHSADSISVAEGVSA